MPCTVLLKPAREGKKGRNLSQPPGSGLQLSGNFGRTALSSTSCSVSMKKANGDSHTVIKGD